jgi:hypothetical protein
MHTKTFIEIYSQTAAQTHWRGVVLLSLLPLLFVAGEFLFLPVNRFDQDYGNYSVHHLEKRRQSAFNI